MGEGLMQGLSVEGMDRFFDLPGGDIRSYSPLTLAYLGDAVYELMIRTLLVRRGNCPVGQQHKRATGYVNAAAQSAMGRGLAPFMTQEEGEVYKRGRNAHAPTMAKHARMSDYRHATALESLIGYLYLQGKQERIYELLKEGLSLLEGQAPPAEEVRDGE